MVSCRLVLADMDRDMGNNPTITYYPFSLAQAATDVKLQVDYFRQFSTMQKQRLFHKTMSLEWAVLNPGRARLDKTHFATVVTLSVVTAVSETPDEAMDCR